MNCHEVRQHWNLYHDSEGEAELHFQVNAHLAECPACAEWFAQQSRLEGILTDKLRAQPGPTAALWNRVLVEAGLEQPAAARPWRTLLALAAMVAAAVGLWWWQSAGSAANLTQLAGQWHRRLADGQESLPFYSRSDLEVEAYLRRQVSFPVRCPPRQDTGFAVEGAGVGQLADQPTAYLSGKLEQTPVSIFVLPSAGLASFPAEAALLQPPATLRRQEADYTLVARVIDRNAVVVIGQTDASRLERLLNAYGTYPD